MKQETQQDSHLTNVNRLDTNITENRAAKWVPALVAASFFMEMLDATIITTALPQMAITFQTEAININIGVSSYMLTLGVLIPASGWLSDRFGARPMFCLALFVFTFASFLCGLSTNLPTFVASRILQGIGGAMMVPVGRLVVLRQTPKERLVHTMALLSWPGLIAPVLGPTLGGFLAQHFHWSLIFYINIPIGLALLLVSLKIFPNEKAETKQKFDFLGFVLTGLGLALLLFAAEEVGGDGVTWTVLLFFIMGLCLLYISVLHLNRSMSPLVALNAMQFKTFSVYAYGGSLFRMTINAVVFLMPLMAQLTMGFSPTQAGLLLMPIFLGNLLIKPFTTPMIRYLGFRNLLIWNTVINCIFLALCGLFQITTPVYLMVIVLFFSGVFRSIGFTAINTVAFADVPKNHMNSANTLFSTIFQLSMGLGIALGAIMVRFGDTLGNYMGFDLAGGDAIMPFKFAFFVLAILSLFPLIGILQLDKAAGDIVAGRVKR